MKRAIKLCSLLLLLLPLSSFAQGTISDGPVSLTVTAFGSGGISMNTSGIGAGDQLFATGYWYRTAQDTQEYPVTGTVPDSQSYVGDTAVLVWNDVGGRGLYSAELTVSVDSGGIGAEDFAVWEMKLTALEGSGPVEVFFYADPDMDGGAGGDSAYLYTEDELFAAIVYDQTCMGVLAATINTDPTTVRFADAFQATPFAVIRNALNDAALTDLDNTGLPMGPGDVTFAFQHSGDTPSSTLSWIGQMIFWDHFDPDLPACDAVEEPVPVPGPGPIPLAILAMLMLGGAWHFRGRFV